MEQKIVLSEQRKGEIALAMLIEDVRGRQTTLKRTDILKNIGRVSKDLEPLKITKDEVIALYRDIVSGVIGDIFGQKHFWDYEDRTSKSNGLSEDRKREIALCFWKIDIKNKTLSLNKNEFLRKMGNVFQALKPYKIPEEEIMSLYQEIVTDALQDIFEQKLTWGTK